MDREEFTQQYVATFLASLAAEESRHRYGRDDTWLTEQPIMEAMQYARRTWYEILRYGTPQPWAREASSTLRLDCYLVGCRLIGPHIHSCNATAQSAVGIPDGQRAVFVASHSKETAPAM